jgi:hypothetical protein
MARVIQFKMNLSDFERRELDRMAKARGISASDVLRAFIRNERTPPAALDGIVLRVELELTEDEKARLPKAASWADSIRLGLGWVS